MDYVELINLGISIATFLIMVGGFIACMWAWKKITENHLAHMDIDLKDIKESIGENTKNIGNLTASFAYIKGFLDKQEK